MKYFVQCKRPDGEIDCGMFTEQQIIDMVGMSTRTGCEYTVFDVSLFGNAERLMHLSDSFNEPNYHRFVRMTYPRATVFSGFSKAI